MKIILEFIFDNNFDIVFIMYRFEVMKQKVKVMTKAEQERIERFKLIKSDYDKLSGTKTAKVNWLCMQHGASSATVYKALKMKGESK